MKLRPKTSKSMSLLPQQVLAPASPQQKCFVNVPLTEGHGKMLTNWVWASLTLATLSIKQTISVLYLRLDILKSIRLDSSLDLYRLLDTCNHHNY